MDTKQIELTPMSNKDIELYFPDAPIYKYTDLKNFKSIDDLFKKANYFFLLYLDSPSSGHWVCCIKKNNNLYFFDSYGYKPDNELSFVDCNKRKELGTAKTYLTDLFNKSDYDISYNNFDYQNKKTNSQTCGRHCCFFLKNCINNNMDLEDYYKYMQELKKKYKKSYDSIVSMAINQ